MKLYGSAPSPFTRMTRMAAAELGLADRVEFVVVETSPYLAPGQVAKNPLARIPFLEMDDGAVVYDSRVVVEALEMEAGGRSLTPASGRARIEALTRQALGVGLCDSAVASVYERRMRPEEKVHEEWIDAQFQKIDRALDAFEAGTPPEGRFDVGDCAWATALSYLDLRFPDRPWATGRPRLAAWYETVKARPSVAAVL